MALDGPWHRVQPRDRGVVTGGVLVFAQGCCCGASKCKHFQDYKEAREGKESRSCLEQEPSPDSSGAEPELFLGMKVGVKQLTCPRVPAEFPMYCKCVLFSAASGSPWKPLGAAQSCGLAQGLSTGDTAVTHGLAGQGRAQVTFRGDCSS